MSETGPSLRNSPGTGKFSPGDDSGHSGSASALKKHANPGSGWLLHPFACKRFAVELTGRPAGLSRNSTRFSAEATVSCASSNERPSSASRIVGASTPPADVTGVVFVDAQRQRQFAMPAKSASPASPSRTRTPSSRRTGSGAFRITGRGTGIVFVSTPGRLSRRRPVLARGRRRAARIPARAR